MLLRNVLEPCLNWSRFLVMSPVWGLDRCLCARDRFLFCLCEGLVETETVDES